ncbi:hypothetical protein IGB42_02613 [Andreprevotia sp. IGB-42]|uniref:hypothetical protein n=1 Tax=Andreprevotia sp. IGB-42 TaxID=2497473 RepID=UPI001358ED6F|nr:hypothetical protein [Andreprevotia sp. IGB-42]KAF0812770.1 hypothetical protein IGB42_02613 [Andreprevotia sp. IGB-42]
MSRAPRKPTPVQNVTYNPPRSPSASKASADAIASQITEADRQRRRARHTYEDRQYSVADPLFS